MGIGLAIGIERERRHVNKRKAMGVRTFILLALLGALTGYVTAPWVVAVITLFAAGLIIASYLETTRIHRRAPVDLGLTTEFAAGVVFVLGYLAHSEPFLSTIIGLLTLIVLLSRPWLHEFTVKRIRSEEIEAAVILFVLGIGILPLLPKKPIDPWGILSVHSFVVLLLLIASVQFLGYLATRFFGPLIGLPLTGLIYGFVSSTAVFLTMPQRVKENPTITRPAAAASLLAAVSTFVFLLVVIGAISVPLLLQIAFPILVSIAIGSVSAYFLARQSQLNTQFPQPQNPLSLIKAVKLAIFLLGLIFAIGVVQHFVGNFGTQIVSFVAGLGELQAVAIASASLFANGKIAIEVARNNILLAALASMLSKLVITGLLMRGRYTLWVSSVMGLVLVGFATAWLLICFSL